MKLTLVPHVDAQSLKTPSAGRLLAAMVNFPYRKDKDILSHWPPSPDFTNDWHTNEVLRDELSALAKAESDRIDKELAAEKARLSKPVVRILLLGEHWYLFSDFRANCIAEPVGVLGAHTPLYPQVNLSQESEQIGSLEFLRRMNTLKRSQQIHDTTELSVDIGTEGICCGCRSMAHRYPPQPRYLSQLPPRHPQDSFRSAA